MAQPRRLKSEWEQPLLPSPGSKLDSMFEAKFLISLSFMAIGSMSTPGGSLIQPCMKGKRVSSLFPNSSLNVLCEYEAISVVTVAHQDREEGVFDGPTVIGKGTRTSPLVEVLVMTVHQGKKGVVEEVSEGVKVVEKPVFIEEDGIVELRTDEELFVHGPMER